MEVLGGIMQSMRIFEIISKEFDTTQNVIRNVVSIYKDKSRIEDISLWETTKRCGTA